MLFIIITNNHFHNQSFIQRYWRPGIPPLPPPSLSFLSPLAKSTWLTLGQPFQILLDSAAMHKEGNTYAPPTVLPPATTLVLSLSPPLPHPHPTQKIILHETLIIILTQVVKKYLHKVYGLFTDLHFDLVFIASTQLNCQCNVYLILAPQHLGTKPDQGT